MHARKAQMSKLAGSFGIIVLRIEDERLNALKERTKI